MRRATILDTDVGYDPDDLFALLLCSPNLIVTSDEIDGRRARYAKTFLELAGKNSPIAQGAHTGSKYFIPDIGLSSSQERVSTDYLTAIRDVVEKHDQTTYIGIGTFTNLAHFIHSYPELQNKLDVYQMGGALDFTREPGWVEHNVRSDIRSARKVLSSDLQLTLILADTTSNRALRIDDQHPLYKQLQNSEKPIHQTLVRNLDLFHNYYLKKGKNIWSHMHDPLTVSAAMGYDFVKFDNVAITMNQQGTMQRDSKGKIISVSKGCNYNEFMDFLTEKIFS